MIAIEFRLPGRSPLAQPRGPTERAESYAVTAEIGSSAPKTVFRESSGAVFTIEYRPWLRGLVGIESSFDEEFLRRERTDNPFSARQNQSNSLSLQNAPVDVTSARKQDGFGGRGGSRRTLAKVISTARVDSTDVG